MHPPATAILSCSLELHLNTSCTPGTSYLPQSLEYLTETSTSSLPWLLSRGFPYFLFWFQTLQVFVISRPSHLSTFFSYLGDFLPPLLSMLLLHPPSFSPSLAFVSTILWLVFSRSHSSFSIHADDPVDLSCIYFCSACGSYSQTRVISSCGWNSSLRSVLSMLPPACPAASCHQPSRYCRLYCSRTSSLRIVLAFLLLFHET